MEQNYLLWSNSAILIGVVLIVGGFALDILCVLYTFVTWVIGRNEDGVLYPFLGFAAIGPAVVIYIIAMSFCEELY